MPCRRRSRRAPRRSPSGVHGSHEIFMLSYCTYRTHIPLISPISLIPLIPLTPIHGVCRSRCLQMLVMHLTPYLSAYLDRIRTLSESSQNQAPLQETLVMHLTPYLSTYLDRIRISSESSTAAGDARDASDSVSEHLSGSNQNFIRIKHRCRRRS